MASVLIVDDAADYCAEIATGLARDGHDVRIATNPRDAISLGCVFRPEVLVTDWMLRNYIDGLSVAEVIRIVSPQTQTILITGFASEDLRSESTRYEVYDFIEKPFHLSQIRDAVRGASKSSRTHASKQRIGAFITGKGNDVVFANEHAQEIFRRAGFSTQPKLLSQLFDPDELDKIPIDSETSWVEIAPSSPKDVTWHVRCRELVDHEHTIWIVVEDSQLIYRQSTLVYRLLGFREPSLDLNGHVLVVDDDETVRQMTAGVLRDLNCVCHAAHSHEEAIRLFVRDADVRFAILDYEMPEGDPRELIKTLIRLRPEVRIVGTSGMAYSREFAEIGVERFLPKPWNLEMLIDALTLEN